jgi:inhibitor of KinA
VLITPLGDRAVLIRVGDRIDERTHRLVRAACARLDRSPPPGFLEYVPGYTSVAVHYDPTGTTGPPIPFQSMAGALRVLLEGVGESPLPAARLVEVPVCYGGNLGPDLEEVAARVGMPTEEVVAVHTSGEYLVHMLGFVPGFAYLGGLDERLAVPRRSTPRPVVPASSVGIGGRQTGIYPIACPGGWHLIGRTPLELFRPEESVPVLLRMGDRVRFLEITRAEYDARVGAA